MNQATTGAAADALSARLSPARMAPYLSAMRGNAGDAIRLYQWNIELSGAVYELLHLLEVVLRNAMDEQLCEWNSTQTDVGGRRRGRDWLMDPAPLLRRLAREKDVREAQRRAQIAAKRRVGPRRGAPVEHADVLANLSLGTWRYLLPDKDDGRQFLWAQALTHAFPHWVRPAADLTKAVERILLLRNRIAHLEPLLNTNNVQAQLTNTRLVLEGVDPVVAQWAMGWQRVTRLIAARPMPR